MKIFILALGLLVFASRAQAQKIKYTREAPLVDFEMDKSHFADLGEVSTAKIQFDDINFRVNLIVSGPSKEYECEGKHCFHPIVEKQMAMSIASTPNTRCDAVFLAHRTTADGGFEQLRIVQIGMIKGPRCGATPRPRFPTLVEYQTKNGNLIGISRLRGQRFQVVQ